MDIRQTLSFEVKKGDFSFSFIVPVGATWGQCLDASFDIMQEMKANIAKAVDAQTTEEEKE